MTPDEIVQHVNESLALADRLTSKLSPEILAIEGMSSARVRHFLNNMCSKFDNYLEVGILNGSTLLSACYQNKIKAVAFDNWSEYGATREQFDKNMLSVKPENVTVFEKDCFSHDVSDIKDIDVYLYDGAHDTDAQYKGITHFYPCLSRYSIMIVDDWSNQWMANARLGTYRALIDLNVKILHSWETEKIPREDAHSWWGGQFIALIDKGEGGHNAAAIS